MIDFDAVGLGLDYGTVRLATTRDEWSVIALELVGEVAAVLGNRAIAVEHIGSTTVPGLLAKPVLDLAAGIDAETAIDAVVTPLEAIGWIYRGDGGERGGHVFVLETRPLHRVAHLHVVVYGGRQWRDYGALRARLRDDPAARAKYSATKVALAAEFGERNDHNQYTDGKAAVVSELLERP